MVAGAFGGPGGPAGAGGVGRPGALGGLGGVGGLGGTGWGGTGGRAFTGPGGLGGNTQVSAALTNLLTTGASSYTWVAATVGSESAAPLQRATWKPILAIGGFNGTDPTPTLAQFQRLVSEHKIHYFVGQNRSSFGGGSGDASRITSWVESHFTSQTVDGVAVYNLTSQTSPS
jgi:hypothetical protein